MQLIESRTSHLPNDTSYTSREAPSCRQEADSIVPSRNGFTLLELLIATTILSFLRLMAFPLARITIQRDKERRLRRALWEMRDAIDKYAGDRAAFQIKVDSFGYPPDLNTLVKGIEAQGGKRLRYQLPT